MTEHDHPKPDPQLRALLERAVHALDLSQLGAGGEDAARRPWAQVLRAALADTPSIAETDTEGAEQIHTLLRQLAQSSLGTATARHVRDRSPDGVYAAVLARMVHPGEPRPSERAEIALQRAAEGGNAEAATVLADVLEATGRHTEAARWRQRAHTQPALRFAVLGPLRAWRGNTSLPLGSPLQQAVLTVLLFSGGKPVPAGLLLNGVWGSNQPRRAKASLQRYIVQLRTVLGSDVIIESDTGYELRVPSSGLDLAACTQYTAAAKRAREAGQPDRALELLVLAHRCWKGEPLAGVAGPFAQTQRAQLTRQRLELFQTRLDLGGHAGLLDDLTQLCAQQPLRQQPRLLLMLALDRSGRRSEALEVYAETERILADELDLSPGPELVALHQRLLGPIPCDGAPSPQPPRRDPALSTVGASALKAQPAPAHNTDTTAITKTGPGAILAAPITEVARGSNTVPSSEAAETRGPTVQRILLGAQMRRLREAHGFTREAAGAAIRASAVKIARLEQGKISWKARDLEDLLTLYGINAPEERASLLSLAHQASSPGWWHQYSAMLPSWMATFIGLESSAASIRTYETQFVPGLLQTADYARAVVSSGHPQEAGDDITRRVNLRLHRQQILHGPDPVRLRALLDESVLRRPLGSRAVLREQLQHLLATTELPHVTIELIPLTSRSPVAVDCPVTVLHFPEPDLPDVVYLEHLTSALYLDSNADVGHYRQALDRQTQAALTPSQTRQRLTELIEDL
ncbi:Scr1 family TA system antitoxin-like transcriptional regulator [Streptomyces phaeochromogenes]|uniref:Scr1 family TA system antitoxin-like transcriptional regulator n=1 Tax=Streptomyces phaeochromogenes TaxID=1923 RepID=UPI002E2A4FF0|nr:Scr1 family TA system antitoxin-like transcriptional regulator [Streptomyces phaeochromogenes]